MNKSTSFNQFKEIIKKIDLQANRRMVASHSSMTPVIASHSSMTPVIASHSSMTPVI